MMNLKQEKFNEIFDDTDISILNEPRLACVLLLDTSSSMTKDSINNLNKAISDFKEQTAIDGFAQERVDIAVIEFNSTARVVQDFIPLAEFQPMTFIPSGDQPITFILSDNQKITFMPSSGNTAINEGINLAIDKAKERDRFYDDTETPYSTPYIFMITNGKSNDDTSAVKQRIIDEKIKFITIGVPEFNLTQFKSLTEHYIGLQEVEFNNIFDWFDENEMFGISFPNEPHLACVLLLDTSSAMTGDPIDSLNKAINDFKKKTAMDEFAQKRVDIAVIEFNDTARVVQDFTPFSQFQPINLTAGGLTAMGEGINLAIDKVKERNRLYNSMGTPCFKPWIFMITAGEPTDDISIARQRIINEDVNKNKLKFWAIGIPGFNSTQLTSLTKRCIALNEVKFDTIFNWLSESMVTISVSNKNPQFSNPIIPSDW